LTPISIDIPESLVAQKAELDLKLAGINEEETKLASQRTEIQDALRSIDTAIVVLSGQPFPAAKPVTSTGRKPMSLEARQRIAEGLRKAAQAKALAKAAEAAPQVPEIPHEASVAVPTTKLSQKPVSARKRARNR
jgi:hypothetical protein